MKKMIMKHTPCKLFVTAFLLILSAQAGATLITMIDPNANSYGSVIDF